MNGIAIAIIVTGKFVLPALIVVFPFGAAWANLLLDSIDGDLLVPLGLPDVTYQPVDKIADWATYVAMVVAAYRAGWPLRRLILALFLFRSIGQTAFLLTREELWLAAFPNFLEPLFLAIASFLFFQRVVRREPDWRERAFAALSAHRWAVGTIVVVYKLQDEFFTHVANVDRTTAASQLIDRLFGR